MIFERDKDRSDLWHAFAEVPCRAAVGDIRREGPGLAFISVIKDASSQYGPPALPLSALELLTAGARMIADGQRDALAGDCFTVDYSAVEIPHRIMRMVEAGDESKLSGFLQGVMVARPSRKSL